MARDETTGGADREQELLEELRRLVTDVDPVPADVTAFAKAALGWRRIDAELAELLTDSALQSETSAQTRAELARARSVTFHAPDLDIELEIEGSDSGFLLLGQLAPADSATIAVQDAEGTTVATAGADAFGRFRIELTTGGRIRLRITGTADAWTGTFETSWLTL
jgi:multidrug efflux pump subunit AcrA (membrane-fusion protein)